MIGKKTPTRFTITPGDPWLINGAATEATSPHEALREIYAAAKRFPITVEVEQGEDPSFFLEMDSSGRTAPIQDTATAQTEAAEPSTPAAENEPAHEEPTRAHELLDESSGSEAVASSRRLTPLALGLFVLAVLVAGAVAAAMLFFGGEDAPVAAESAVPSDSASASTPQGWKIPDGQRALTVFQDQVVTLEGSTLRILNAETGEQLGDPKQVKDPENVRYLGGTTAGAVDTGRGEVIVLQGNQAKVYSGSLNARGPEPVVVAAETYRTSTGAEHAIGKGQAVLAGTAEETVLAQGPNKITIGKRTTALKAPVPDAKITQWVGASNGRSIVEWGKGAKRWLVSHDNASGAVKMQKDITGNKVSVRSGKIWVGTDQYLQENQVQKLCAGGQQVDSSILCPEGDHWITADHKRTFSHRPEAVSPNHAVIDGMVTREKEEK